MILDWLLRHTKKETERMSLEEKQPEQQPQTQTQPQVELKAEEEQGEQQSKLTGALDDLTVDKSQLVTSSPSLPPAATATLALTSPSGLKIEAPLHSQVFVSSDLQPSTDDAHSHNIAQPSLGQHVHSFGTYSLATESAVDKLEAAYKARILHIRTVVNHLGKEAEADVLALFDKHPIVIS